jgi:uncharacterized damage-inducible protein DinB
MNEELVQFARAVRESTLSRLNLVPIGSENWRVDSEAMSFADTAQHLIDSDHWLSAAVHDKTSTRMLGRAHTVNVNDRGEYEDVLNELGRSGKRREDLLSSLSREALKERIEAAEIGGEVTTWWAIVRGNLDHEIHHRGQVVAYLRTLRAARFSTS